MKATVFILLTIALLYFFYPQQDYSQQKQKDIVEEVSVEWWVVPVFAVDGSGNPVLDLDVPDIELMADNRKIETFTLVKKSYTESGQEQIPVNTKETIQPPLEVTVRTKNVFLVFDTALSTKDSTERAKAIARKIIDKAEKNAVFYILGIEPLGGLVYAGGQTNDKNKLIGIIDKKIKSRPNTRIPSYKEVLPEDESRKQQYTDEELQFIEILAGKYYKRKNQVFTQSFETLYYALNTIKDNKFVYLFTEGIPNAVQDLDKGDVPMYRRNLNTISDYLGRAGAVLFIINSVNPMDSTDSAASGVDSLLYLAQKSGGKYLEGKDNVIAERIENIHRAYYEIFFPASANPKSGILRLSVSAKRKGVNVHTMQTAEKTRTYYQMQEIERQVMVLNLISNNPLYRTGLNSLNAEVTDIARKKNKTAYEVSIPGSMLDRNLDMYKVWLNKKGMDTRVEKETVSKVSRKIKITFDKVKEEDETYFVLIDGVHNSALVYGVKTGETPDAPVYRLSVSPQEEIGEWLTAQQMEKEKQEIKPGENIELDRLLKGAAVYCEKLKNAAFHYICVEKIVETLNPMTKRKNIGGYEEDIGTDIAVNPTHPDFIRVTPMDAAETPTVVKVNKQEFNYRIIKNSINVREQREKINPGESEKDMETPKEGNIKTVEELSKSIRFLSSKAIFGPITLLDAERQGRYHFKLVGHEKLQDRNTAIVEAVPRNEKDSQFIYGKLWIDTNDFSVLKIKANPNSILGYEKLQDLAHQMNTMLHLNLETEFYKYREGIRFPTRIRFEESYKGGSYITHLMGSKGWMRTLTVTQYTDYLFFNVGMDITYENRK